MCSSKKLLAFFATALYAWIAVSGYGLHALLPCHVGNCDGCRDESVHCCGEQRHAHNHDSVCVDLAEENQQTNRGPYRPAPDHDPESCFICSHLSQAQIACAVVSPPTIWQAVETTHGVSDFFVFLQPKHEPFSARGPPATLAENPQGRLHSDLSMQRHLSSLRSLFF